MNVTKFLLTVFAILLLLAGCSKTEIKEDGSALSVSQDKAAILDRLNKETRDAFSRNYDEWTDNWVHNADITKVYINFADSTFSESVGWKEISGFVKAFMKAHPDPEPVPQLLENITVRIYGKGAWVTYEQMDSLRGLKRETRLMEKIGGEWKIAGMQTTIYGDTGN